MIYLSSVTPVYNRPSFKGRTMNNRLEKDAVKTIYDYVESKISSKDFDNKFNGIIDDINKNNITVNGWLRSLICDFKVTDDVRATEDLNYISHLELILELKRYLQILRNNNQYTDIIKQDYSRYL